MVPERQGQIVKRIDWVDVLKCIGIFIIYFWHLGEGMGKSYEFLLRFHVPLFFFLSGCMESLQKETGFSSYVWRKVKNILIPFFFFAFFSMLLVICYEQCGLSLIGLMVKQILLGGMRNRIFAYSLWFLTCLFVMSIFFQLIKKLKRRSFIFITGMVLYVVTARFLPYKPDMFPLLPYNADCALYYTIYYCTGYCIFPELQKFLESSEEKKKIRNIVLAVTGVAGSVYAVLLFWGTDVTGILLKVPVFRIFHPYLVAMLLIIWCVVIAFCLQKSKIMQQFGRESLYLCGNEFFMKTLVTIAASFWGISIPMQNAAVGIVYVIIVMHLTHFMLIPIEKQVIGKIEDKWKKSENRD